MSKNEFDALLLKKLQEEAFEYNPESWKQLSDKLNIAMPVNEEITSFDTLLVAKLQEENFEYNPKSWNQLAEKLDNKVPESKPVMPFPLRKWGIAIGTAAAIVVAVGLAVKFNNPDNKIETNNPAVVKNTTSGQQVPEISQQQNEAQQNQPVTNPVPSQSMAQQSQSGQIHNSNILSNLPVANNQNAVLNPNNNQPVITVPENKAEAVQTPNAPVIVKAQTNEVNTINKEITAPAKQESNSGYIAQNQSNHSWPVSEYGTPAPSKPKTNISFGGGVNYGNINTGYTAGISVKRKIGSDFFVDGTVAMMYNNNANNVAANNGPSVNPAGTAARPSSSSINSFSTPALDPIQKLYYVQMNPSFGYQIEDKIALSVGGDFQKMLNKKDEIVQPDNNNTKIFPTMDIGLTTKSEFIISPNLQAGLVYREGLNNLFKGDAPYVNRRYVQVQFKYNIPLR
ncbi:hypothetical protein F0919_11705 [Taibaiella lutea]|uniref:Outer membrane protein beta-barrel domain-containing protein n=1 Tax=Taibaiella lutea TaxID=2608001 RepID=A0A5M6CIJ2_9BACT|nr:hypothetical protein [Taibaiella lutea]KAA5533205.1 hypothetical protein F0919_11705 [Taibaiella lutea]